MISTRAERRDYMERHGLVDHDPGIRPETEHWTWRKDDERQIGETMKRYRDTDTDYWPDDVQPAALESGSLDDGTEIDTAGIDIVD